jgi:ABC-type uncharacterized transport system ATPase component
MDKIYIELKKANTTKTIERTLKQGNTYVFFVKENFNVKDRNDRLALANDLNYQLKKDRKDSLDTNNRSLENELMRLEIGKRVEVRIN